jgi:ketosteroid isomerase-like protein
MNDAEKEIVELERKYWQAMVDRDLDAALQMTANPCVVTGASGPAVVDHDRYRKMFEGAPWELLEFTIDAVQTRSIADDVIVVAYNVTENMVVDGKPLTLKAADSSVWVRRDGQWVNSLHTESILGDSYGRDRDPSYGKTAASKPAAKKKSAASKRRQVASRRQKTKR